MAEKVVQMPGSPHSGLQLSSASGTGRGLGGDVPPASEAAIHAVAGGQSLSDQQRSYFEPLFGADFSGIRLHTGPSADQAAESIGALAYTRGRDVVFRRDHYRPDTESGQQLLAHELAHTVQQGSAPAKPPSADRSGGNIFSPLRLHSPEPSVLRLHRQEELHDRTLQELFVVTESLEAFQHAIEEWLARSVMSSAAREQALVGASNLAALHQQLLIGLEPGQTVRIQAALEAGQDRYEHVIFSTPGLTILDPLTITGSPQEAGRQEADSDSDGEVANCFPWTPADAGRTWALIARFLSEWGGDYSLASAHVSEERNQLHNCCDLSYTAASHYLTIIVESMGAFPAHCAYARLLAAGRTAQGLAVSGDESFNPMGHPIPRLTSIARRGNCPVSPFVPIVSSFQFSAADFVCNWQLFYPLYRAQGQQTRATRGLQRPQPPPQSEDTQAPQ